MGFKRKRMNRRKSEKYFSKAGEKTHVKNVMGSPMRGGIRL